MQIVQTNFNTNATLQVQVAYLHNQTAGNTNIFMVGIGSISITITSFSDSNNNTYFLAGSINNGTADLEMYIYCAYNIAGGANTVTVNVSSDLGDAVVYLVEVSNNARIDSPSFMTAAGVSTAVSVGPTTLKYTNEFMISFGITYATSSTAAGTNWVLDSNSPTHPGAPTWLQTSTIYSPNTTSTATISPSDGWLISIFGLYSQESSYATSDMIFTGMT